MKIQTTLLMAVITISLQTKAQSPSMKAWEVLLDKKELADYFKGTFERLGIYVDSTNEAFTVVHAGDKFVLENGVDSAKADYIIKIKPENVRNMRKHGADGKIDENESFKIQAAIFTPVSQSMFASKDMGNPKIVKASKIENHMHIHLISNDGTNRTGHTLIWVNNQWVVAPGFHGKAKRVFKLNPQQALEYQRQVFTAKKTNTKNGWKAFLKWYNVWKDSVSVVN